jgi:hypothetical protein
MKKRAQTSPNIAVETINILTGAEAIVRGEHIATIWSCIKCHGADLSSTLMTNDQDLAARRI